jgi:DNA-binding NarL/FixJ family response regulator
LQVILNKKEKEELAVKLYQDGKPIREIARQTHLSFGTILSLSIQIGQLTC